MPHHPDVPGLYQLVDGSIPRGAVIPVKHSTGITLYSGEDALLELIHG